MSSGSAAGTFIHWTVRLVSLSERLLNVSLPHSIRRCSMFILCVVHFNFRIIYLLRSPCYFYWWVVLKKQNNKQLYSCGQCYQSIMALGFLYMGTKILHIHDKPYMYEYTSYIYTCSFRYIYWAKHEIILYCCLQPTLLSFYPSWFIHDLSL